jgi:hypothetical protein
VRIPALVVALVVMDRLPPPARPSSDDVLAFWFADANRWWKEDPEFDDEIRDRFLKLQEAIQRGECEEWLETPPVFLRERRARAFSRRLLPLRGRSRM